ncbi:hypothetical protein L1278_002266 [Pontibacter sp. HSC-36F09]|nr:hypothetical protein [Pontibacter sp. HSC-36F09]
MVLYLQEFGFIRVCGILYYIPAAKWLEQNPCLYDKLYLTEQPIIFERRLLYPNAQAFIFRMKYIHSYTCAGEQLVTGGSELVMCSVIDRQLVDVFQVKV